MRLNVLFQVCRKIVAIELKQHPGRKIKVDNEYVQLNQVIKELEDLENWCYKDELDIRKVTRCRDCKHYKRYKHRDPKNPHSHSVVYACEYDKMQRKPEYYCARGEER